MNRRVTNCGYANFRLGRGFYLGKITLTRLRYFEELLARWVEMFVWRKGTKFAAGPGLLEHFEAERRKQS